MPALAQAAMDNLGHLLLQSCSQFADAPALVDSCGSLSYRELAAEGRGVTQALGVAGLAPDEPVLVPVANEARDAAALAGVWLAGGVAVPVARHAPAPAIEAVRAATGARLAVANDAAGVTETGDKPPPERALLKGAALIVFTSGSTGRPKGVVLSHCAFAGKLKAIDSVLGFTERTRTLVVLQITFIFGMWVMLLTLLKGGTACMHARFEAAAVLAALKAQRISDAAFVPTMLRRFLSLDETVARALLAGGTLERILTGGEPFGRELGARLVQLMPDTQVVDIYGLTETCSSDFFLRAGEREQLSGTIGRPGPWVEFRIADEGGRELPVAATGELQIRTPFAMNGYLDEPELTRKAFAGGYFRTGDLARSRGDGAVELAGRIKEVIVRGGAKVSPLELDQVLAQHPDVAAVLTTGVPDAIMGERIHALIVPRANAGIDEQELREWIAGRIESFKRPDVYHFAAELPTGRTGKIDRNALREQVLREHPLMPG
jgi:long-chain acyl-CoA synthetase